MSQRGFANPAILAAIGTIVAGCTLFLFYENQALKTTTTPPPPPATEQSATAESNGPDFPLYPGSTFVKKESVQNCRNSDTKHPVPICESVNYEYTSSLGQTQLYDWYTKAENTKPWTCVGGITGNISVSQLSCSIDTEDQYDLELSGTKVTFKHSGETNDTYTYLEGWQTVFGKNEMYSYPLDWTLDDSGLKSSDYEDIASAPGKTKLSSGCVINRTNSGYIMDIEKKSQSFHFLGDKNGKLNSWQNPIDKTSMFEIVSAKKIISLEVATADKINECKEVLINYAKSFKMLETPEQGDSLTGSTPQYTLLETN